MQPEFVEYDGKTMSQPGFDLILSTHTLKELGIVLNFRTKEIDVNEIILPMRDISNFQLGPRLKRQGQQTTMA